MDEIDGIRAEMKKKGQENKKKMEDPFGLSHKCSWSNPDPRKKNKWTEDGETEEDESEKPQPILPGEIVPLMELRFAPWIWRSWTLKTVFY